MSTATPIPQETRASDAVVATEGQTVFGPFLYRVWGTADVVVETLAVGALTGEWATATARTVTLTEPLEGFSLFTVTFDTGLAAGTKMRTFSRRLHERSSDVTKGGGINSVALEKELDQTATIMQEVRRDVDAALDPVSLTGPVADVVEARDAVIVARDIAVGARDVTTAARDQAVASATASAQRFVPVRVVDTSGVDPATDYTVGSTVDGVTLAPGDLVLRATSPGHVSDGVYVAPTSGAAARLSSFASFDDFPAAYFSVAEGTANEDTLWRCTSNEGGAFGVNALKFEQFSGGLPDGGSDNEILVKQSATSGDASWKLLTNDSLATNAAIDAAKVSVLASGINAVPVPLLTFGRGRTPTPLEYGAVLNDTGAAARAANKTAIERALAAHGEILFPLGAIHLPDDAVISIPAARRLIGCSPNPDQGSRILGDGNIFLTTAGADERQFENFAIANETTGQEGTLMSFVVSGAVPRHLFTNVRFGKASRHLTAGCIAVGWTLRDCFCEQSIGFSRVVFDSVDWSEFNQKDAYNESGVSFADEQFGHFSIKLIGGFREQHNNSAVYVTAGAGLNVKGVQITSYFEANGLGGGAADIQLTNAGAGDVFAVSLFDAGLGPHAATTQTGRVARSGTTVSPATGGAYWIEGTPPLLTP